jgi:sec-independent protein translocase protein TatB
MLNLDPAKLLVILVIGLIVVGPEKLPALARQFSGALRSVTRYREQLEGEIKRALPDLDLPRIPTNPSAMVSGFMSDLMSQPAGDRDVATSTEATEVSGARTMAPPGSLRDGVAVVREAARFESTANDPAMN